MDVVETRHDESFKFDLIWDLFSIFGMQPFEDGSFRQLLSNSGISFGKQVELEPKPVKDPEFHCIEFNG